MKRYLCPRGDVYAVLPPNGRCPTHDELLTVEDDGAQAVAESVTFEAEEIIERPAVASAPRKMERKKAVKKAAKKAVKKATVKAAKKPANKGTKKAPKKKPKRR